MSLTQMQVFNQYIMPATYERIGQMIQAFNAASNGAIILNAENFTGDFLQRSFFQNLSSARRRVDRYATNAAVTPIDITEQKESAVKVAGGFGPVRYEPGQMTWLQRPTAQGVEVAATAFSELLLQDQLNTVIACLRAAIENQTAAKNDVSAGSSGAGALTQTALNSTHALFGDSSQMLVGQIMTGQAYHKLIEKALVNTQQLFVAGNVRVIDILGKSTVVTDAPALYVAGTPNKTKVLSLVSGAGMVMGGSNPIVNIETNNGAERIVTTMQADYDFAVRLKGYTWDETNGGKSPTDAELATGTNWDKVVSDIKQTAGVITIADAAQ